MPATDLSLADLSHGDLVRVGHIRFLDEPDPRCRGVDLRTGEVVRCVENADGAILLARSNGTRVLLPDSCARAVSVRLFG